MRRHRVLVIDDEPKIAELIATALSPSFEVTAAADGAEGLRQAQALQPNLILLDLVMPGMDGLTVLAKLKGDAQTSAIPVVIVSAKGETSVLREGQRTGAVDHLIKPFTIEALRRQVGRCLCWDDAGPLDQAPAP
ncbi:MAG: response regulator [Candidatus Omnitrophica bacterium]|nr:response regulator [Candidatus Omnitrophota bacterium]